MMVNVSTKRGSELTNGVHLSNYSSTSHDFDTIKALLIQKYGRPISEETKPDELNVSVTTVLWSFPSTSIELSMRNGKGVIFLDYIEADT